jgi:N-acetylglucosamine kinase-like BadF-type ATPase
VTEIVLAVDGGNSKTDLALVAADGGLLSLVRGPQSSPHHLGLNGCLDVLSTLLDEAVSQAGIASGNGAVADVGELTLAGVDFPAEEQQLEDAVRSRPWARRITVRNDTFAVLRAGTERGWGVAVVCGAGINCVGVAPDGRHARFPSLGAITGDWGGGYDVGLEAVWAAARSEDGRGPKTSLEEKVPAHFGLETPIELAEAIHAGRIGQRRVIELAPMVLAQAQTDAVAHEIVDRLVAEVAGMARVALTRLGLEQEPVEVLLGGGLLQTAEDGLLGEIDGALAAAGPSITVRSTRSPAIVGAALLGLDALHAKREAQERLREELGGAVERLGRRFDDG